jgi:L-threonylcarbamoyladenylate synthase
MARVLEVDVLRPDLERIAQAATVIREGGLVAFPTETVYGLGANALDPAAVERVFEAKGRPPYNPLIVHVASASQARRLVTSWPPTAAALAERFWPGPLTLVLPKASKVPDRVTAGLPTVAVRVPAHPVALALLEAAGLPIAAPSANPFAGLSPTTAEHVRRGLGEAVDLILDAGPTTVGIESAVVDLSGPRPALLRPGSIPPEELESLLGDLDRPELGGSVPRPAPGMLERHYAPHAKLQLYPSAARRQVAADARRAMEAGRRVGALVREPLETPLHRTIPMPGSPAAYARRLYAALHELDQAGCDLVLVEEAPDDPAWAGIRDRLTRASR